MRFNMLQPVRARAGAPVHARAGALRRYRGGAIIQAAAPVAVSPVGMEGPCGPIGSGVGCPPESCTAPMRVTQAGIAAGATVTIMLNTTQYAKFQPQFFQYTGPASTFVINSVVRGNHICTNGPIPADFYLAAARDMQPVMHWVAFDKINALEITVANVSAGTATFDGVVLGIASYTREGLLL